MRVVVLGAGLLGVTSAYYLQQLGHEVTVVDRHSTPAAKARGRVAEDAAAPRDAAAASLAGAGNREGWRRLHARLRRSLAGLLDRAIGMRHKSDPMENLVRLAAYSRRSVRALSDEVGMPQSARTSGLLNFFTDADTFGHRSARAQHWRKLGCEERLLTAAEAVVMEPALRSIHDQLAGATYSLEDPARDPGQFAASLVFLCRAAGVRFMMKHTVVSLQEHDGRIDHVELADAEGRPSTLRGQAYVLALGSSSVPHAERLKIAMPLRFAREYIVTIPLKDPARAPRLTLRDRQGKLRIARVETPTGECLRVSGTVPSSPDEQGEPDSDRFHAILRRIDMLS